VNERRLQGEPVSRAWAAFLVAGALASGTWAELDRLTPAVTVPFALLVVALALVPRSWLADAPAPAAGGPATRLEPSAGRTLLALALAAPAAFLLVATWGQEFPFAGDHDFHLLAAEASLGFWRPWLWLVPAAAITGALAHRAGRLGAWSVAWLALLAIASPFAEAPWYLARVPGGAAFLGLPAVAFCEWTHAASVPDALRLTTFTSLLAWLLVLRPALIGRRPDAGAALFAAFFWMQKDVVYYLTTSYSEPWMIVLVLLAAEHLLSVEGPRELRACLLVGVAALIKEPAILVLPFAWLACRPWRGSWSDRTRAMLAGVVAGAPFLLYYAFRREAEIWRGVGLAPAAELLSPARFAELGRRFSIQLGWPGLAVTAGVVVLAIVLARARPQLRFKLALLGAAACGQVVFFFSDALSTFWTGYSRFHLLALALVGAGLLVLPEAIEWPSRRRMLAALAAAVAALQLSVTLPLLRLALLPDPARSFFEHYEAPYFFPIASLIAEAEREGDLAGVRRVAVSDPIGTDSFPTLEQAYPEIERRFDLTIVPDSFGAPRCTCREPDEALLVPFVYFTNLTPQDPAGAQGALARERCRREMVESCERVIERSLDGARTGLLGIGVVGSAQGTRVR
jgi:hypothetical protein